MPKPFLGELALDGKFRPIKGILPIAIEARKNKLKGFILSAKNAMEASIVTKTLRNGVALLLLHWLLIASI